MSPLACIGLFAAVVATWIAISGPGEAALVSAGTIAARGEEQIAAVLVIAFLGTFAGSLAAYWIGRAGGRRLFLHRGPLLAVGAAVLALTVTGSHSVSTWDLAPALAVTAWACLVPLAAAFLLVFRLPMQAREEGQGATAE